MACVRKDDDRQTAKRSYWALPPNQANIPVVGDLISGKVVDNQNDEIANGNQGDHARVLQRIEPLREAERNDKDQEECRDPKFSVAQEVKARIESTKGFCHSRHKVANDDHVGHANSEALDGNRSIKYHSGIRVRDLRQGEEGGCSPVQVASTPGLEIQAER